MREAYIVRESAHEETTQDEMAAVRQSLECELLVGNARIVEWVCDQRRSSKVETVQVGLQRRKRAELQAGDCGVGLQRRVEARRWRGGVTGPKKWTKAGRVAVADRYSRHEGCGLRARHKKSRCIVHMRREKHASRRECSLVGHRNSYSLALLIPGTKLISKYNKLNDDLYGGKRYSRFILRLNSKTKTNYTRYHTNHV